MSAAPTSAPTYMTTMLYVIQRIDGITLEQSLDSKFESAFVTGVISGSSVHMSLVKYVESKSALYGEGVDCEYFVEAKNTNAEELTAVVRSGAVTDTLVATLQASGYTTASCSAQAIIVDVSPTSAPTFVPTYSKAYLQVKQHVDGVTVEQAQSDDFIDALQESIAGALQVPESDVLYNGASEQGLSGVEVGYTVALRNTDIASLQRPLEATHTSSALTSALHLAGFADASAQPVTEVLDVSPTASPTPLQTSELVVIEAKQAIYGVTYTQANADSFTASFKEGLALGLDCKVEDVSIVSVEGTPLSATIVYITFDIYQPTASYSGVSQKLQSEETREIVGKKLIAETGYSISMPLAAETSDLSPTPVPTARPTNLLTMLRAVQRVDGITQDEVEADTEKFDTAFVAGIVSSTGLAADDVTVVSIEQAQFSKNAVNINYEIRATSTNGELLADLMTTEAAATKLTGELVSHGFEYCEVTQPAIVADASPTAVPTGRPTQYLTIMQIKMTVDGVTVAQAQSSTFTNKVQLLVAGDCDIPATDIVIVGAEDSANLKGVQLDYSVQATGTNSLDLGGCLGGKSLATHLTTDLQKAGFTAAMVAVGIVEDKTPTGAPSYMPTQQLTLIQAVQLVSHISAAQANEPSFTSAFQRSLAASCDVPIGNVNIINIASESSAVDIAYTVQAPESNYVTLAAAMTSPEAVESLSVAIQKAGYRDAWVDSPPTLMDVSPTFAPTVAQTLQLVVLTVTQDVAAVTVSQASSSEFQAAFVAGAYRTLQEVDSALLPADVTITAISTDSNGGDLTVTYTIKAQGASPQQLKEVVVSADITNSINTELHAAGFAEADVHGRATIVDSSPTGAPSMMPTVSTLLIMVNQRVDGISKTQAESEQFNIVIKNCVSTALSTDSGDVVFQAAETAVDNPNSVYVSYTVREDFTNYYYIAGQLASQGLKDSCTSGMQTNGFRSAQMLENPTMSDLSPTLAPTVNPHYPTMAPTVNPLCGDSIVVIFTQRVDGVNIMQASNDAFVSEFTLAVAKGANLRSEEVQYLSQNPSRYGVAVDMVYQVTVTREEYPDSDALIEMMKGNPVTDAETSALHELGYPDASCSAEAIPLDLCKRRR